MTKVKIVIEIDIDPDKYTFEKTPDSISDIDYLKNQIGNVFQDSVVYAIDNNCEKKQDPLYPYMKKGLELRIEIAKKIYNNFKMYIKK